MEEQFKKYCDYLSQENKKKSNPNPIEALKSKFDSGQMDFYDFLDSMYQWNKVFQITANNLKNTGISKVEVTDDRVIYTTREQDVKLSFDGNDRRSVPFELLTFGEYELEEMKIFDQIIGNEFVLFDIGANIGWYSINWAKKFPNSTIYAFEPIPETYGFCIENIKLNKIDNVQLNKIAISASPGFQEYFFSPETSVLASSQNIMNYEDARKVSVTVDTLDGFVEKNSIRKIDLLKCDVEGGEFDSIIGGIKTIKRDNPMIVLELFHEWAKKFDYHPDDAINFLLDLGYTAFLPKDGTLEPITSYLGENFSRQNYFFMHKKNHFSLIRRLKSS